MARRKLTKEDVESIWRYRKKDTRVGYQKITTNLNEMRREKWRKENKKGRKTVFKEWSRQTVQEILRCKIYVEWAPDEFKEQCMRIEVFPDECIISSPLLKRPPVTRTIVIRKGKAFPKRSKKELLHQKRPLGKRRDELRLKDLRDLIVALKKPAGFIEEMAENELVKAYLKRKKSRK